MIEDKLTHEQRIRLEALNQTHQRFMMSKAGSQQFWFTVQLYENYIRSGTTPVLDTEQEDD